MRHSQPLRLHRHPGMRRLTRLLRMILLRQKPLLPRKPPLQQASRPSQPPRQRSRLMLLLCRRRRQHLSRLQPRSRLHQRRSHLPQRQLRRRRRLMLRSPPALPLRRCRLRLSKQRRRTLLLPSMWMSWTMMRWK